MSILITGCTKIATCLWSKNSLLCYVYGCLHKICGCLFHLFWKAYFFMLRIKVLCEAVSICREALQCSPAQTMGSEFFLSNCFCLLYFLQTIWNCIYFCSLPITSFFCIWISNICFHIPFNLSLTLLSQRLNYLIQNYFY